MKFLAMEPADSIIERLGGVGVVAEITGTAYTAPYRWKAPRDKRGTGGVIPWQHVRPLLDYAKKNGIPLAADDFLPRVETVESDGEPAE